MSTQTYPSPSSTSSPSSVASPIASESGDDHLKTGDMCYRLEELAFLRSGDKGDSANIGMSTRMQDNAG